MPIPVDKDSEGLQATPFFGCANGFYYTRYPSPETYQYSPI